LTPQYLSINDIHGIQDVGKCVRLIDVQNNFDDFIQTAMDYDLPIVILDAFSGLDYTLSTDRLGHYRFQNNDQIIVISSLSPYVESDTGAWILGHELSHFSLFHKTHDESIYLDWVHEMEDKSRSCLEDNLSLNDCPELWTTVKAPSGKNIKMMKIYSEEPTKDSESSSVLDELLASLDEEESTPVYDIKPSMTNGYIKSMTLDSETNTLILKIQTKGIEKGFLQVVLPRELIDARFIYEDLPVTDQNFQVDVDGTRRSIKEVLTTETERIIQIPIPANSYEVKIQGEQSSTSAIVIPEFQEIALMVLGSSIVLVIVIARKFSKFPVFENS